MVVTQRHIAVLQEPALGANPRLCWDGRAARGAQVNAAQALGRLLLIALIGGAGFWYGRQSAEPQPCDCGPAASAAASAPAATESGPTQAVASSSMPAPGAVAGAPQPLGCFRDMQPLDLDGHHARSANNTPLRCVAICADLGFAYAGLQYGESCLCGNQYGRYGTADNCNLPCTGNLNLSCGGYLANSVYSTGVTTPPVTITATGMEADKAEAPAAAAQPGDSADPGSR
jgi:hypothetical protein